MNPSDNDIYSDLRALIESSFPKKCNTCGRTYQNAAEFILETEKVGAKGSGLKSTEDYDGSTIVELFRNCPCGSTLMDAFNDRRDLSEKGETRRKNFDKLLKLIQTTHKIEKDIAREELLKIMRGQSSDIIKNILPPGV
jgi:hypothetical protein